VTTGSKGSRGMLKNYKELNVWQGGYKLCFRKTLEPMNPRPLGPYFSDKGLTLIELLVTLAIFSVVIAGVYAVYITQIRHSTREYILAESEMELVVAKTIIERDIMMAGYGIADDYNGLVFTPSAVLIGATDNISPGATENPLGGSYPTTGLAGADSLYMTGTALGIYSRAAQKWTCIKDVAPVNFEIWGDPREDIESGDRVIYMEPNTRTIITDQATWRFEYPSTPAFQFSEGKGILLYGLSRPPQSGKAEMPRPYYIVQYRLGGSPADMPGICSKGTRSLERAEMSDGESIEPLLSCVRDFQVSFGLDTDDDGTIDTWDPINTGNFQTGAYDLKILRRRLKQVRVYILVQAGNRDPDYMYSNPDNPAKPNTIRVGEIILGTGRDITLTTDQRRYRWRVMTISVTPRNVK
jgi:prepilin-type N-terminal cleavage/methylation domain-containing protein